MPTTSMRYKPADHGPRVGRKWSDPVRAVILRAESALLPRGRGGPLGGPAPAARAAGKTRAPKWDPRDQSRSVQWFLRESAFLPAVGEALGGSSTRSSRCGTSPCSIPLPQYVRHVSPHRTTPVPRRPRVANAVPHKQAPVTVGKQQTPNLSIRRVSSPSTQAGYPSSSTSTASWVWVSISRVERWERRLWLRVLAVKVGGRCTGTKGFATRTRSDGAGIPGRGQC